MVKELEKAKVIKQKKIDIKLSFEEKQLALRDEVLNFALKKDELDISDESLTNVFKAIKNKLNIKDWVFPHPLIPTEQGNVSALLEDILNRKEVLPLNVVIQYYEALLYMIINKSRTEVEIHIDMQLNDIVKLFKTQREFLSNISEKSIEVLKMLKEQTGLNSEEKAIIEKLSNENFELESALKRMDFFSTQLASNLELLHKASMEIRKEFEQLDKKMNEVKIVKVEKKKTEVEEIEEDNEAVLQEYNKTIAKAPPMPKRKEVEEDLGNDEQ